MGKGNFPLYAFNRGEVSRLALGRTDIDRLRLSAEEQVNWQPMVLGPMTLRPGLQYLGATRGHDKATFIPFVFGNDDTAALELTGDQDSGFMRVWVDDAVVSPRKTALWQRKLSFTARYCSNLNKMTPEEKTTITIM